MTAPAEAGEIRFPVIQTCEQGELAWIEIPAEGAAEPEHPAPTLKITAGPPTAEDLTPEEEEASADAETRRPRLWRPATPSRSSPQQSRPSRLG